MPGRGRSRLYAKDDHAPLDLRRTVLRLYLERVRASERSPRARRPLLGRPSHFDFAELSRDSCHAAPSDAPSRVSPPRGFEPRTPTDPNQARSRRRKGERPAAPRLPRELIRRAAIPVRGALERIQCPMRRLGSASARSMFASTWGPKADPTLARTKRYAHRDLPGRRSRCRAGQPDQRDLNQC
jgi:hypothetical protein